MKFTESKTKRYEQIRRLVMIKMIAEKLIEDLSDIYNSPICGESMEVLRIEGLVKELNEI